jgi:hypothetical protein
VSTPFSENDNSIDRISWAGSTSGIYEARSGYIWLLTREKEFREDNSWRFSWKKLRVPEKVKFLLWLIFHDASPTNLLRYDRTLSQSMSCPRCSISIETVLHCLPGCGIVRNIWFLHNRFWPGSSLSEWYCF